MPVSDVSYATARTGSCLEYCVGRSDAGRCKGGGVNDSGTELGYAIPAHTTRSRIEFRMRGGLGTPRLRDRYAPKMRLALYFSLPPQLRFVRGLGAENTAE